ncbi:hypothetical protein L204_100883 [Cryptococcus depauperatus]|nr:hypothetical protein L204_01185 [Cryptococcus depauperatus CBS 7855]
MTGEDVSAKNNLAVRQAALQKALSTAYLNHQIAELESKVKSASINPLNLPTASPVVESGRVKPQGNVDAKASPVRQYQRDPNDDLGRPDDVDSEEEGGKDWRVVVVDISALMWAKNAVKRLVSKGWEVIVPLGALHTLDLLKKGNNPSAVAARQAARYIEHAVRFHSILSNDPVLAIQSDTNYKRGRGVRVQRQDETLPVSCMLDEMALPPMNGEEDLPKWVEGVFGCVAFFKTIMDAEEKEWDHDEFDRERGPILYVANPPVFVEVAQGGAEPTPSARDGDAKDGIDSTARAEGHVILQEAARFDITLQLLRDDDVEVEAGLGSRPPRRRRRGRGKEANGSTAGTGSGIVGGGCSGRRSKEKKEPEPEREVKILLRRPASPQNHDYSPESSYPSPLPSPSSPAISGSQIKARDQREVPRSPAVMVRPQPMPPLGTRVHQDIPIGPSSGVSLPFKPPSGPGAMGSTGARPPQMGSMSMHSGPPGYGQFGPHDRFGHGYGGRGRGFGGRGGGHVHHGAGGRGGGGGGGGKPRTRDNEFVLLQRPHSFVRPVPPSPLHPTGDLSISPPPIHYGRGLKSTGCGHDSGLRKKQSMPRIDDPPVPDVKPKVVLLQRPK